MINYNMIVSFDIGIRNLAICIVDYNCKIKYWDIINIMSDYDNKVLEDTKLCNITVKSGKNKGSSCNKKAYYIKDTIYYCNKHKPKNEKEKMKKIVIKKKKNVRKMDTQTLCLTLIKRMNEIVKENDILTTCEKVIIELQPRTNQRMKLISHTLYSYFLTKICDYDISINENNEKGNECNCKLKDVRFVAAKYKLRNVPEEETDKSNIKNIKRKTKKSTNYAKRKKLAIEWTKELLKEDQESLDILNKFKKQDDLCDSYLQAKWFIENKI